jgi:hypothetical protein
MHSNVFYRSEEKPAWGCDERRSTFKMAIYSLYRAIFSKVVHYIGNRMPFGTEVERVMKGGG